MPNPGAFIKSYRAEAAISGRTVVKFGSSGGVVAATAATDAAIGITDQLDAAAGDMVDVIMSGSAEAALTGTVDAGDPVRGGSGGAVAASSGTGNVAIGYALSAGVSGDIIDVAIARHSVT
ncbi:capsid cement protein [uncultured Roseovarius sp.]|uniref:capsid cement protein n=1 Tax=uncultured Roseovarius sp. TaxID=293344 RepID=UPI002622533E|nr:capsid cement protein [uncultured Roseovarius sp.]